MGGELAAEPAGRPLGSPLGPPSFHWTSTPRRVKVETARSTDPAQLPKLGPHTPRVYEALVVALPNTAR